MPKNEKKLVGDFPENTAQIKYGIAFVSPTGWLDHNAIQQYTFFSTYKKAKEYLTQKILDEFRDWVKYYKELGERYPNDSHWYDENIYRMLCNRNHRSSLKSYINFVEIAPKEDESFCVVPQDIEKIYKAAISSKEIRSFLTLVRL